MKVEYFRSGEYRLAGEIEKIKEELSEVNKNYALKYCEYLQTNSRKAMTLSLRMHEVRYFLRLLNKNAKDAKKEDIERLVRNINNLKREDNGVPLALVSRERMKLTIKTFFRWLHNMGLKDGYPDIVRWIDINRRGVRKLPEQMLNEDDIRKLILACNNQKDKSVIAMLWDTGARIGELLALRMQDIVLSSNGVSYAIVNGKTGPRRIPLVFSIPYLSNYINDFRNEAKRDEPFFIAFYHGKPAVPLAPLDYHHVQRLVHTLEKTSGVDKRLNPHIFRHSRATHYANKLTEQQLKVFFGWSGDSRMASTYVHLSGSDIDDAVMKANGMVERKVEETKPQVKKCQRCQKINELTSKYCVVCGLPLDNAQTTEFVSVETMRQDINDLKNILDGLLSDKKLGNLIKEAIIKRKNTPKRL